MDLECPCCNEFIEIEGEDLPSCACDENEFECPYCESILSIGWYAEAECRGVVYNAVKAENDE